MGLRPDVPDAKRQPRLSALKRLALRLLVAAEDDGLLGRVQVEADDIPELRHELWILRHLERPGQMRLDVVPVPDRANGVLRNAYKCGHCTRAVPRVPRRRPCRFGYYAFAGLLVNPRLPAPPGLVGQSINA